MKVSQMIENLVFGMDMARVDEPRFRVEADAFLKEASDRYGAVFSEGKYTAEDGNHMMRWVFVSAIAPAPVAAKAKDDAPVLDDKAVADSAKP